MADYDAIVVGGGLGGVSAGALLAQQGRSTLLVEQSDLIGGCCSTFVKDGYRFDLGASIVEAAPSIDEAFRRLGSSLYDEVELVAVDPVYDVIMKDGTKMTLPLSPEDTIETVREVAPDDAGGWAAYYRYMDEFLDTAFAANFFGSPTNSLADLLELVRRAPALARFLPLFMKSYQSVFEKYLKSEHVKEAHGFQSFYAGLPPELCPGHMALLPALERRGIFYPKGGMIQIPEALQRLGQGYGLEVRLGTCVDRVLVDEGRARGVVLTDGTEITGDLVVSDINAKTLYLDLIGEEHLPWLARRGIKSYDVSMATPMLYLGVDYEPPLQAHHTLCTLPMEDLNHYWAEVYGRGDFPTEQFGIISWTSSTDTSLAPPGHHVICLTLAPGPYKLRGAGWDHMKPYLTEKILAHYSKRFIPGLKEHVEVAEFSSPVDFERRLMSPGGAIYALRQDATNLTVFRPSSKSKAFEGLYLVGASTGAGGGVPSTILSGAVVADLIERYEG